MNKNAMTKVFIDGSAGTTGLRIYERLSAREDLQLISLSEEMRKDPAARKDAIHAADAVFLCLPDAAAIEAASGKASNRAGVTMLTRLSVHWAERITATRSWKGLSKRSSEATSGRFSENQPIIAEYLCLSVIFSRQK